MALMQIVIGKKIEALRAQLTPLDAMRVTLEQRRAAMAAREAELEAAINEVTEETSKEDQDLLDEETQTFAEDERKLTEEETANTNERSRIETEIEKLQNELNEVNARADQARRAKAPKPEERKDDQTMETRKFFGMTIQERDDFMARDDVKAFIANVRAVASKTRAVENGSLLIPNVVLGVMANNLPEVSKMYKHVNVQRIPGTARMVIAGNTPEGVWTEMCANSNEVNISFSNVEIEGWMVSAIIYVCNAILQDSDINLAAHVITELTKGVALALDKAILYGTGDHMPMGIVTRLTQTAQPAGYPATARPWENLSSSHVVAISGKTGIELFQALYEASGVADSDYSTGGLVWAMNRKTKSKLVVNAMNFSASGAIASGVNDTMPVIGGAIEELNFIPDDGIIMGYGDAYILGEREGATVEESSHYRWAANQTGLKIVARYDGKPAIPEAFVAIGIGGVTPSADDVTFAADTAN